MIDLEATFIRFKNDTVALISCLETEDFNALEGLMNDRQSLIDEMKNTNFDKQQFQKFYEDLEIEKLNLKMYNIMSEKMNSIKSEIKKVEVSKNVNNNYSTNVPVDSIFFNKKI